MKRTIVVYPRFDNGELLHEVRERFDPRAQIVAPHITLVYPFVTELSDASIIQVIEETVRTSAPFRVLFRDITGFAERFLLLNVKAGNDRIVLLHDKLYHSALQTAFNPRYTFFPHMVIGSVRPEAMSSSLEALVRHKYDLIGDVSSIVLERCGLDGRREKIVERAFVS